MFKPQKVLSYSDFITSKAQIGMNSGFAPTFMPDFLFGFQQHLADWSIRRGRSAILADCGLGKTALQLVWCQNMVEHTNKPALLLTPLSVGPQTVAEGLKFGIECAQSRDGKPASNITVTNYQQLKKFNWQDFSAVACDESSILKNVDGALKAEITEFMRKVQFRSLYTATAAPNDYIELGTSSEALGELGFMDMLSMFFKKAEATISRSDEFRSGVYRFRGHAQKDFWRWVCSWARAVRKPSDLGFSDDGYVLPEMITHEHVVKSSVANPDFLFDMPAVGLAEQRKERRRSIKERCEMAASIVCGADESSVSWCDLNDEGEMLKEMIPNSVNVEGKDDDEYKEEVFAAFASGKIKNIISKASIAGFGLNWQHCALQTHFAGNSFEQYYQKVRRSYRFGQKRNVNIHVIASEGGIEELKNMKRKAAQAEKMFEIIVSLINNELKLETKNLYTKKEKLPNWI